MPTEGQKSITVKESIYDKAKKKADKEHRSVSNIFEFALMQYLESEK